MKKTKIFHKGAGAGKARRRSIDTNRKFGENKVKDACTTKAGASRSGRFPYVLFFE